MLKRLVFDRIFQEMQQIRYRFDHIEASFSRLKYLSFALILISTLYISTTQSATVFAQSQVATVTSGWENNGGTSVVDGGFWDSNYQGSPVVVRSPVNSGNYAVKMSLEVTTRLFKTFSGSKNNISLRFYMYVNNLPLINSNNRRVLLRFYNGNLVSTANVWYGDIGGSLGFGMYYGTTCQNSKAYALKANQWYYVEFHQDVANSIETLSVNGVLLLSQKYDLRGWGGVYKIALGSMSWEGSGWSGSGVVTYDDVAITDGSYIGPLTQMPSSSLKLGMYVNSWNFREYSVGTIASTFDMSQSHWIDPSDVYNQYDVKMGQVLSQHPDYKFLVYRNAISVSKDWVDQWNYAKSQGWLLKDINGNYVTEGPWSTLYGVDVLNSAYQRWLGSTVSSWLSQHPSFAGVFVDNVMKYNAAIYDYCFNNRPVNPRTGTYFTDSEIRDGMAGVLNAIIDAVGTSKLVIANGINRGAAWWYNPGADGYRYILSKVPRLSGISSEGTFRAYGDQWYSESDWKMSVDFVAWVQDNFLSVSPERCFSAGCQAQTLPSGATIEQVMEYGFASMLLAVKYSSPMNTIDFMIDYSKSTALVSLAQKLRSVDLAAPLGAYYKIDSTSVYARDFVRGKVLVNPMNLAYTVSLAGVFTTINGVALSGSVTIRPHTGLILLKN
jgi:hypothetical protein